MNDFCFSMKRFARMAATLTVATLTVASCGEDRTGELAMLTQHNEWMLREMGDQYLWADSLRGYEPEWKDWFLSPKEFLKKVGESANVRDDWSYVTVDTVAEDAHRCGHFNHVRSYGFDFTLMGDPTGQTTNQYARVMTVYANSPAAEAGLRRDDFVQLVDGYKVSAKNEQRLEVGDGVRLTVQRLAVVGDDYVMGDEREVRLGAARYVEDVAFPCCETLQVAGIRVGYVMCTRLVPHAYERENATENEYADMLDEAMRRLREAEVSEVVVDLRLCNDGTLEMAQRLASHLVNPMYTGTVFAMTVHNKAHAADDRSVLYDRVANNLSVGRVCFIVSERTKGAAEWLVHGLQSTMGKDKVLVVGKNTAGQSVQTVMAASGFALHLYPVVAYVTDCNGVSSLADIRPNETVDENSYAFLGEYGDEREPLFAKALIELGIRN